MRSCKIEEIGFPSHSSPSHNIQRSSKQTGRGQAEWAMFAAIADDERNEAMVVVLPRVAQLQGSGSSSVSFPCQALCDELAALLNAQTNRLRNSRKTGVRWVMGCGSLPRTCSRFSDLGLLGRELFDRGSVAGDHAGVTKS